MLGYRKRDREKNNSLKSASVFEVDCSYCCLSKTMRWTLRNELIIIQKYLHAEAPFYILLLSYSPVVMSLTKKQSSQSYMTTPSIKTERVCNLELHSICLSTCRMVPTTERCNLMELDAIPLSALNADRARRTSPLCKNQGEGNNNKTGQIKRNGRLDRHWLKWEKMGYILGLLSVSQSVI